MLIPDLKKILLLVQIVMVAACYGQAATIYVDSAATGLNNGSSWTDAFNSLQDGLSTAVSGDEIWVANGTYMPGDSGQASATFNLKNGVILYGGFEGAGGAEETMVSQRDFRTNLTILSGDLDSSGTVNTDDAFHVVTCPNTDTTATLDGFYIRGGNAVGAGLDNRGGGIQAFGGACSVYNTVFENNVGVFGGGIRGARAMNIINCDFRNNICTNRGGAIYQTGAGPTRIINCTFYNNVSPSLGGGVFAQAPNMFFWHCSFNNNVGTIGSAIYNFFNTNQAINCIFWDNAASDIAGTSLPVFTSIVEGGYGPGTNILDVDPLFADTLLRIRACSPAVDAGDSLIGVIDDYLGNARPFDGDGDGTARWDLGAYESQVQGIVPAPQTLAGLPIGCVGGQDFPYTVANNQAPINSYAWTLPAGGTIDTGADSSTVLIDWGASTGTFDIYLTETVVATGCFLTDTFTIPVDTAPAVNLVLAGNDSICDEDSLQLAAVGTGSTFQWTLDGNPIPGATDSTFFAKDAGFHNVVLTNANGCSDTASANLDLFVHPLPNITFTTSIPPAICFGDSVTITAPAGVSMQWYENGLARPNDTLDNITVSTAGLYNMIQVDANGCSDSANTGLTVQVNPLPTVTVNPAASDTICPGDSLSLSAAAAGATSFQWTRNGTPVPGATTNPYFADQTGFYNVLLTDSNTCVDSALTGHALLIGDFANPNPQCQDTTVYLDNSGSVTIDGSFVDNGSTDNCVVDSFGLSQATFVCADTGQNSITVNVFDGVGNFAPCISQITVEDSTRPVAVCNDTTLYLDNNGLLTLTPADVDGGSSDNCGIGSLQVSQSAFACADTGLHVITLTVIDVSGNVNQCTAQVTVLDSTPPLPNCIDTLVFLDPLGNASITANSIENGSTDNCGIDTFFVSQTQFGCSDVPGVNVTLSLVDVSGNLATCTRLVRVRDTVAPVAVCNDTIIYIDNSGQASLNPSDVDGGSSDNCGIAFSSLSQSFFTCLDTGINAITVSFADADTNISTCTSNITILDTIAPVAVCSDTTFYLDSFGVAVVDPFIFGINSTDNCTFFDTIFVDVAPFTCSDTGTHVVNLFLSDVSGRADSCSGIVTIADSTGPFTLCRDTSLILGPGGFATLTAPSLDSGTVDNCTLDTIFIDRDSFFCADAGLQLVTLTGRDIFGNTSQCISQVTVVDSVFPVALCKDSTLYLDASGNASLQAQDLNNGSSDNCFLDTLFLDRYTFGCVDTGLNVVSLTVEDQFGNATTCTSNVTVLDSIRPTAVCQNSTVILDSSGNFSLNFGLVGAASFDNCLIFTSSLSQVQLTCQDTGVNAITLTVTDPSGNLDSCIAQVTALDTLAPITDCPDTTLFLDAQGSLSIQALNIAGQTFDNCLIDTSFLSQSVFGCGDVGTQSISATFIDPSGNSSTCTLNLTVLDTVRPQAQCNDTTIILSGMGEGLISIAQINDNSSDACGIDTVFLSQVVYNCGDLGNASATLTVTDVNGNTDSCMAVVTVLDTLGPTANCLSATVYFDSTGQAPIDASDFDGGSTDECGIDTVFINPDNFDCTNFGSNLVVLNVLDNGGNLDSCSTTLFLLDTIAPVAVCDTTVAQLTATGGVVLNPAQLASNSFDNCIIDSIWLNVDSLNCGDIGFNPVLLSLRDTSGNMSNCTEIVQVVDTTGIANVPVDLGPDTTACNGDSVFLTPGGGFLFYQWSDLSGDTSLVVDSAGIYFVDVISPEGCFGTDTIEISTRVVVDPDLRSESGEMVICDNDQLVLLVDTGYVSYIWSTGSTTNTTTITAGGNYDVIVTDTSGCTLLSTISINYVPTPAPAPVITPPGPIDQCEGVELTLDAGSGYFAYLWSTGNTTQFQSVTQTGAYGVQVWNGFGCHSMATPVVVTQLPAALPQVVQNGDTLVALTPAVSFQWNLNGQPIVGANDSIFIPGGSGNYSVSLTYTNGCTRTSLSLPVLVSVPEALLALQGVDLYPNPAQDVLYLRPAAPLRGTVSIRLINAYGQVVLDRDLRRLTEEESLPMDQLPAGVYQLELLYDEQRTVRPVAHIR